MEGYVVNEQGEKVLPGSRRPDGTVRKERKIRSGYIPQDEQPVYQSTGMMARHNIPKCPGLDPEQETGSSSAKSKSAKKNEKRKAKKAEAGSAVTPASSSSAAAAPQPATAAAQKPPPVQAAASAEPAGTAAAGGSGGAADAGTAAVDKQIKALSKKVRQCQALVDKQAAGEALSQQEQEKVAKMAAWQEEIKDLEHQLAKLMS